MTSLATDSTIRYSWPAMGNTVHLVVTLRDGMDADGVIDHAMRRVEELEAAWSRFRADSDVSRFNRTGRLDDIGADTRLLFAHMDAARRATRGTYDARILGHIVNLGYTHSLVDYRHATPGLHGNAVDPGGLGKGLAADIVAREIMALGADGVLVSIGGDMRCMGRGDHATRDDDGHDDRGRWIVDIERPGERDSSIARIALRDGGVATSNLSAKRWERLRADQSHVVDPRSGISLNPLSREVVQATVIASTGAWADAFATACLVSDPREAMTLLDDNDLAGLLVTANGRIHTSSNWNRFAC